MTTNRGKFVEISRLIQMQGHEVENISINYPEIQADNLDEVAIHGLSWLMERYRRPLLIDDSGLFVDALGDFPGVYSAYAFKTIGCKGILRLMDGEENRSARFECCLGYMEPSGEPLLFRGIAEGSISLSERGEGGFGFDPIFIPADRAETFAELPMDDKNMLSHRGRAFEKFFQYLREKHQE